MPQPCFLFGDLKDLGIPSHSMAADEGATLPPHTHIVLTTVWAALPLGLGRTPWGSLVKLIRKVLKVGAGAS